MSRTLLLAAVALGAVAPVSAHGAAARLSDYTLTVTGQCPGLVTIEWSGATPNHRQGTVIARQRGSTTIPSGGCQGTVLGLQQSVWLTHVFGTDKGFGTHSGWMAAGYCRWFIQLVEGATCHTSNVAQLP